MLAGASTSMPPSGPTGGNGSFAARAAHDLDIQVVTTCPRSLRPGPQATLDDSALLCYYSAGGPIGDTAALHRKDGTCHPDPPLRRYPQTLPHGFPGGDHPASRPCDPVPRLHPADAVVDTPGRRPGFGDHRRSHGSRPQPSRPEPPGHSVSASCAGSPWSSSACRLSFILVAAMSKAIYLAVSAAGGFGGLR